MADARRRTPRPPPACRSTSTPRTPPCVPRHPLELPHSPELSPPPLLPLSLTRPNGAAATDELPRGHRHPLASPMRSKAPPRPPLPPHRSTALRKPWMLPASPFPSSANADRCRQIRPRPASLKLAVHLYRVYVSSPSVSPSLFRRSRAVARLSTAAESFSPPAMAWPWPQPPQLAPEPTSVLTATLGTQST